MPHRADEVVDHGVDLTTLLGARQPCARMVMSLKAIVQLLASIRDETRNLVDAALAVGACAVFGPRCFLERGSVLRHGGIVARVICACHAGVHITFCGFTARIRRAYDAATGIKALLSLLGGRAHG
jgi:hypothetical protein